MFQRSVTSVQPLCNKRQKLDFEKKFDSEISVQQKLKFLSAFCSLHIFSFLNNLRLKTNLE